jgi:peptide deformylase
MLLDIITYPHSVLKTPAVAVDTIDGTLQEMIDNMIETMYSAPGIGLAANQVGSLLRVIVFDRSPREPGHDPAVLINPEIVYREGSIVHEEACLSVRDYAAEVKRNFQVEAKGIDRQGNPVSFEAEDLLAVCLQHEIDHLNGVLFIDHLSSLKRTLYKKRLKKMLESES